MSELDTRSTLIARVRDPHDSESWREFVELYEPLLLKFVLSRGTPPPEAHDLVQEIFVALLKALPRFEFDRSRGKFRTWLWNVCRNVMVDWARRMQRLKKAEQEWVQRLAELKDDEQSQSEWFAAHRMRVLETALERVRLNTRHTTWACFEQHLRLGRPAAVIGKELGLSANAVYVNASRVLQRVRHIAADFGESLADE